MALFSAKMEHNEKTIIKLVKTQQQVFQFRQRLVYFLLAFVLLVYGIYADESMITPYLALFIGCAMLTGLSAGVRRQAGKLIQQMNGRFPKSDYSFEEEGFRYYSKGELISYKKLLRLVEDREYLYLYISEQSAYMVDKATVKGGLGELKTFLAQKTGRSWEQPVSLFNLRFKTLRQQHGSSRDEYTGPRLK